MTISDEDPRVPVYAMAGIYLFGRFSEVDETTEKPTSPDRAALPQDVETDTHTD